jgi:flagellar assembly protein FliH
VSLKNFIKNRPFEPEPEVLEILRQWASPDFQAEQPKVVTKTNALLKPPPKPGQRLQAKIAQPEEIKPLTAEDIEQIRQAAYEEGLQQGKDEGFSQGYQEGREQGYQDGLQQGQAEGKKQGLAEGESLIQHQLLELKQLLEQLQAPLQQVDLQVQQAMLDLSLAMAQAVVEVEVSINPQFILSTLRQAIDALPLQSTDVRILLAPDDFAVVKQHYSDADLQERGWVMQVEPALARGDIRLQAGDSIVERPLKQRLKQSLEHFLHSTVTEQQTPFAGIANQQPDPASDPTLE